MKQLLFIILINQSISAHAFNPKWIFFGSGIGQFNRQNEMILSTDFKETEAAYFKAKDLTPGIYKISYEVKSLGIGTPVDGYSFWNFYDSGDGQKTIIKDLIGSFDWRKIEYTVEVKKAEFTTWIKLMCPGQVLVKNYSIIKTNSPMPIVEIRSPNELNRSELLNSNFKNIKSKITKLFTFEGTEPGSTFKLKKDKNGNGIGNIQPHKYYNFDLEKMPIKDFRDYDNLTFDVYNGGNTNTPFLFSLADRDTEDYWSSLNFNFTIAKGWNRITLNLNEYLGERGSHRFFRQLQLNKLTKMFLIVDPNNKFEDLLDKTEFSIDNIFLIKKSELTIPPNVLAIDFTSVKARPNNFIQVTTARNYTTTNELGFINPIFYRVEDAEFTNEVNRFSIGILKGHFRVNVPNGNYKFKLNINMLGFWDVPFYRNRMVYVNGKPLFKETRNTGEDFLKELLRFESINPTVNDNPYDLYLKNYFSGIEKTVEVRNGYIDFEFDSDETGVELNSLFIWDVKNDAIFKKFYTEYEKASQLEFSEICRPIIIPQDNKIKFADYISVIEPDLAMSPNDIRTSNVTNIKWTGFNNERFYSVFSLKFNQDELVSFNWDDLLSKNGDKIAKSDLVINEIKNQYVSSDLNHETFFLSGKYLKELEDRSIKIAKNTSQYLWFQFNSSRKYKSGEYVGNIRFKSKNKEVIFPISLQILNGELADVQFSVGFMGLDPLPYSYYGGPGFEQIRNKFRLMALNKIASSGFTTFSGLPAVKMEVSQNKVNINLSEIEKLLEIISKYPAIKTIFSYGGQFPNRLVDASNRPSGMSEEKYYELVSKELKGLYENKKYPKIVHTYSDEAAGYRNNLKLDIEKALVLKKYFPYMPIGGFSYLGDSSVNKLNGLFDYGFYSGVDLDGMKFLKKNNLKLGLYGYSASNLDDPRFTFGPGLFIARLNGLSHYLEWNAIGFHNYPYYDLDGRESDVAIFYPSITGKLYSTIRFELASEGINLYRKLQLLSKLVDEDHTKNEDIKAARLFITNLKKDNYFFNSKSFLGNKSYNILELKHNIDYHLTKLIK